LTSPRVFAASLGIEAFAIGRLKLARSGRWGALLRSCPPSSAFGRRLLLYFTAQCAPPTRSVGGVRSSHDAVRRAEDGGWLTE
jgi:hypothetical protein